MLPPAGHEDCSGTLGPCPQDGRELVSRVDMDAIARQVAAVPTAVLIRELDALVSVLLATQGRGTRVGLLGRLLARDLVRKAHPGRADDRVRLHLLAAAGHAEALVSGDCRPRGHPSRPLTACGGARRAARQASVEGLHATQPDEARPADAALSPGRRARLTAVRDSWRMVSAHLAMTVEFASSVLSRYDQVRDVLLPLWREQATAQVVAAHVTGPSAHTLASVGQTIARQLRELAAVPATRPTDPFPTTPEHTP